MEFTCYVYEGWAPRIRPASARRQWMDDTSDSYAYRCLPLSIANAHGWEMLSPCGFSARWTGAIGAESVEIRLDPGAAPRQPPVSLFGHGTLTFHVEGLFRTPPGWNLWIGGSPNAAKDAIAPLGGVIETDWSPYTFTMNWRFTRPGQWVRFEENEPFCFFFPVQRGPLLAMEPRIRPVEEAPDLKAAFDGWRQARADFQQWVRETNPTVPADQWQKLYYRGVHPDGAPGPADHHAKLRLHRFRLPDGSALDPPPPRACPVAAPPPRFAILARDSDPQTALVPHDVMRLTLAQIGFPPPDAAPPAATKPHPAAPAVDWSAKALAAQQRLAPPVPRIPAPDAATFLAAFYAPARPVIVTGAIDAWPALALWDADYLARAIGKAKVTFQTGPVRERIAAHHRRTLPFDRFLALARADGADARITPDEASANKAAFQPLHRDLGAPPALLVDTRGHLAIGPAGFHTPLARDRANRLEIQLCGGRRLLLVPPGETPDAPPDDATGHEVDLAPGEILFVPLGWWVQATTGAFNVALTCRHFPWPNPPAG